MNVLTNFLRQLFLGVCQMASPGEDKDCPPGALLVEGNSAEHVANAKDASARNMVGFFSFPFNDDGSSGRHRAWVMYGRANPVGDSDYANAPYGSEFHQVSVSSAGAVNGAARFLKTANGLERLKGCHRVVVKRDWGASNTQIDITNPRADVMRYKYDSTGTDPNWLTNNMAVGDKITIDSDNFSDANNCTKRVLRVTDDYFEIENSSGSAESDKTLGATDAVTACKTLELDEDLVLANYSSATTLTLPAASGAEGKEFFIKSIGTGAITIDGNSTETIDGETTLVLSGKYSYARIVCDGSNWHVLDAAGVEVSDPGDGEAVSVKRSGVCPIVTEGAETRTLAAPSFLGQAIALNMHTDGGDAVVTVATAVNQTGNDTLTFADAGDEITLKAVYSGSDLRWRVVSNDGVALTTAA